VGSWRPRALEQRRCLHGPERGLVAGQGRESGEGAWKRSRRAARRYGGQEVPSAEGGRRDAGRIAGGDILHRLLPLCRFLPSSLPGGKQHGDTKCRESKGGRLGAGKEVEYISEERVGSERGAGGKRWAGPGRPDWKQGIWWLEGSPDVGFAGELLERARGQHPGVEIAVRGAGRIQLLGARQPGPCLAQSEFCRTAPVFSFPSGDLPPSRLPIPAQDLH
jgi:hypothetical protein